MKRPAITEKTVIGLQLLREFASAHMAEPAHAAGLERTAVRRALDWIEQLVDWSHERTEQLMEHDAEVDDPRQMKLPGMEAEDGNEGGAEAGGVPVGEGDAHETLGGDSSDEAGTVAVGTSEDAGR